MFYKVQQAGAILSGTVPFPSAELHHFLNKYKILQISASLPSGPCGQEGGGMQDLDETSSHSLTPGGFRTRRGWDAQMGWKKWSSETVVLCP